MTDDDLLRSAELANLQTKLDAAREENRQLRERLATIEELFLKQSEQLASRT